MAPHKLAAFHLGSWPMGEVTLADWGASSSLERILPVRLELVGAGSRGEVDLDGFGAWNARSTNEWGSRWALWKAAGYTLNFDLPWMKDLRLKAGRPPILRYWNINRQTKVVQEQAAVVDVANPAYQEWAVPRVQRAFEVSGADALFVGIKDDRFGYPTQRISVPGGGIDVRQPDVVTPMQANAPDLITTTATPGFRDGILAILRAVAVPFYTDIQLRTPAPGTVYNAIQTDALWSEWVADLAPLWRGEL